MSAPIRHTPGPWHALDIGEVVPSDADGFPHEDSRICFMATAGADPAAPERIEANAHLISAAPDLLEQLRIAKSHIEHMAAWIGKQNAGYSFEGLGEDMPAITAAIAKATGQ